MTDSDIHLIDLERAENERLRLELNRTSIVAQDYADKLREWQELTGCSGPSVCGAELSRLRRLLANLRRIVANLASAEKYYYREPLRFSYCNHRGETADRTVKAGDLWYGKSEWHEGWLLEAFDCEKQADRTFAVADIEFLEDTP